MILDDPAGNSYIENLLAPNEDPQIQTTHYDRTKEQNEFLGLGQVENPVEEEEAGITTDDLAFKEQVHEFPGNCSRCNAPSTTKMHLMGNSSFLIDRYSIL
jgi:zinc finger protein